MIGKRACVIALAAACAITGSAASAIAQLFDGNWGMVAPTISQPFDGNWRIAARTTRGHCENVQFGLVIRDGRNLFNPRLLRRVRRAVGWPGLPSGRVEVHAVAGPRSAQGTGGLGQDQGGGTWAGRGPSGVCSGIWNAYRSWF